MFFSYTNILPGFKMLFGLDTDLINAPAVKFVFKEAVARFLQSYYG